MSLRIEKIVSFVRHGTVLYDLCCDHGKIGLDAWMKCSLKKLIFVDQSPNAFCGLRQNIHERGLSSECRIEAFQSAAEAVLLSGTHCDFVLAGVGIRTIISTINHLFKAGLAEHRLILCPEKNSLPLRHYLIQRGFRMAAEDVVWEAGRYREILVVEAIGGPVYLNGEGYRDRLDEPASSYYGELSNWLKGISACKKS